LFVDGRKCGGGRPEIQFFIPCMMARVIGGAVLLRCSQVRMAWRSDLGLRAPGWRLQQRWCIFFVDSVHL